MLVIITMLAVAVTDLIALGRARLTDRAVWLAQFGWWIVVIIATAVWVRPEAWTGVAAALIAAAWHFLAERTDTASSSDKARSVLVELYMWSAIGLVAVLAGFAWLDVTVFSAAIPAGLMWLALTLFLTQTGNRITRCVLLLSGRELGRDRPSSGSVPNSQLKGGRVIGPLERIFIMILIVVGAYHVVAALMAAKGIVRFPEISADAKREHAPGAKAEEFLVGSLASWGVAGGAGLLAGLLL